MKRAQNISFKHQKELQRRNELHTKILGLSDYKRPHTSFDLLFLVSEYTQIHCTFRDDKLPLNRCVCARACAIDGHKGLRGY
jgi:hypothetical protein